MNKEIEHWKNRALEAEHKLEEWGITGEPPIHIDTIPVTNPVTLFEDSTFVLEWCISKEGKILDRDKIVTCIGPEMHGLIVSKMTLFRMTDALGYKHAVVGAFGS